MEATHQSATVITDLQAIIRTNLPWQKFSGKTVLITGANGFLPAYLIETLLYLNNEILDEPVQVIGLVRNYDKARQRFSTYFESGHLQLVTQDVSQPIEVNSEIHYIIHAASQASPKYYGTDPVGTLSANVLGTMNVLRLAQQQPAIEGVLYFSSSEVYGELTAAQLPVRENQFGYLDPMRVRSCYAESKRMGENICASWVSQFGVPAIIVRPFHTYGPGMALDDGRVYADFVRDILQGRDLAMQSDGSARRAFCYLADATVGFFTALLLGVAGQAYNVGNPDQEYSILQLAHVVAGIAPGQPRQVIEFSPATDGSYLPSPVSRLTPDIAKLSMLGWQPTTTVADGFARTIASYG
jgi:UDP-glucuronate decarboxylase